MSTPHYQKAIYRRGRSLRPRWLDSALECEARRPAALSFALKEFLLEAPAFFAGHREVAAFDRHVALGAGAAGHGVST
jgi:hypothetical protein